MREHAFLPLPTVLEWVPAAEAMGVTQKARAKWGFLEAFEQALGRPGGLSRKWRQRRQQFIERHVQKARAQGEPWFRDGLPTERHLSLIMWAYSPTPRRI